MLSDDAREKLLAEVARSSYETMTLEEWGSRILPLLERAFDTNTSLLYRIDRLHGPTPLAGGFREVSPIYFRDYAAQDPLQAAGKRMDPWLVRASCLPEWKLYLDHPVYTELCHPHDLDYFLHLRIHGSGHLVPGMVGLLLGRSIRRADFDDRDERLLTQVLPALESLARRDERLRDLLEEGPLVRAILEQDPLPKLALDPSGALLWASPRVKTLLGPAFAKALPPALIQAARRFGALLGKKPVASAPPATALFSRPDGMRVQAELRLARGPEGRTFLLVELEIPGTMPTSADLATRFRLTPAESQVLGLLSRGLSNSEISRRLFVSMATVRSHVTHILGKLGLRSRVHAALLAHGISPDLEETPGD